MKNKKILFPIVLITTLLTIGICTYFIPIASFTETTCFLYDGGKHSYSLVKNEATEFNRHRSANDKFAESWNGPAINEGVCSKTNEVNLYLYR